MTIELLRYSDDEPFQHNSMEENFNQDWGIKQGPDDPVALSEYLYNEYGSTPYERTRGSRPEDIFHQTAYEDFMKFLIDIPMKDRRKLLGAWKKLHPYKDFFAE